MYKPSPIDTQNVILDSQLQAVAELLAENTHEVWAYNRMQEGWIYGKEKNGALKTTPLLIPYQELSEEEKEYDRATSLETIKVLLKLGYRIQKC